MIGADWDQLDRELDAWRASGRRATLWCRDDAAVRVELAQLLKALGRDAEARAEAARARKADPGTEAARKLAAGRSR